MTNYSVYIYAYIHTVRRNRPEDKKLYFLVTEVVSVTTFLCTQIKPVIIYGAGSIDRAVTGLGLRPLGC